MSQTPTFYVNSPAQNTQYAPTLGYACIPNNGTSVFAYCQAYAGANGSGGNVGGLNGLFVKSIIWPGGTQTGTWSASGVAQVDCQGTGYNGSEVSVAYGEWTSGSAPGSLGIWQTYTGVAYVPSISSFSPGSGGVGTVVDIYGSNFHDYQGVQFNGVAAASTTYVSDSHIQATVPSGATTGPITVYNQSGSGASASNFIVAQMYAFRSSIWTPGPNEVFRSSAWTQAQASQVDRSNVWQNGQ